MLQSLPNQDEAKNILYYAITNSLNQFENQNDNQIENQFENAYISVSDSLSVLGESIYNLLLKSIIWKEFSNNYGGKRENAGRKSKNNQNENQLEKQYDNQDSFNLANKHNNNNNKYKVNYSIIKLNERDFDEWQKAYPFLNIRAECMVRNAWLENQPDDVRKKWFITTARYFAQQNEIRKKQQEPEVKQETKELVW